MLLQQATSMVLPILTTAHGVCTHAVWIHAANQRMLLSYKEHHTVWKADAEWVVVDHSVSWVGQLFWMGKLHLLRMALKRRRKNHISHGLKTEGKYCKTKQSSGKS
jgi:hypothetical protein